MSVHEIDYDREIDLGRLLKDALIVALLAAGSWVTWGWILAYLAGRDPFSSLPRAIAVSSITGFVLTICIDYLWKFGATFEKAEMYKRVITISRAVSACSLVILAVNIILSLTTTMVGMRDCVHSVVFFMMASPFWIFYKYKIATLEPKPAMERGIRPSRALVFFDITESVGHSVAWLGTAAIHGVLAFGAFFAAQSFAPLQWVGWAFALAALVCAAVPMFHGLRTFVIHRDGHRIRTLLDRQSRGGRAGQAGKTDTDKNLTEKSGTDERPRFKD